MKTDDCQLNALGIRDDIIPDLGEDSFCPAPNTNLDIDPRKGTGNDQIPDTGYRCCYKDNIKSNPTPPPVIKSNSTPLPVNINSENNLCVDYKDIGFRYVFIKIKVGCNRGHSLSAAIKSPSLMASITTFLNLEIKTYLNPISL